MGFGVVKAETVKLAKVGDSVVGYLLAVKSREFVNDAGETVSFAKLTLKTKGGMVVMNVSADYAPMLVPGLATRVSKVKKVIDGEEKAATQVEQDPDDKITI